MSQEANMRRVTAIKNGTVIDHVPAGKALSVLKMLGIEGDMSNPVSLVMNVPSKKMGGKDIIKVEGRMFTEQEANELALFAPSATINVIDDYRVVDKFTMAIPKTLRAAFPCPNSNCITHNEPVESYFYLRQKSNDIQLKCHYCEKSFSKEIVAELR